MSRHNSAFLNQLLKEFLEHQDPSQIHSYVEKLADRRKTGTLSSISPSTLEDLNWDESTLDFDDKTIDLVEDETKTFSTDVFADELQKELERSKKEKHFSDLGELYPVTHDLPYFKIGVLGKGGMGLVVRVEDPSLQRLVALKQLKTRENQEIDAFKREAEITAKLQHPGIIPIYEYGMLQDGSPYFTMQEVRGRTLQAIIKEIHRSKSSKKQRDNWSLRKMMGIFHDVCETVAYAHSQGILHRDLKPQNIMVGQFGEVYVVDWGIAVMMETSVFHHFSESSVPMRTQTSGIAGTPIYMSPEQAKGKVSSFKATSDIYSLGAILFKILSGNNIVSGEMSDIIKQKNGAFQVSLVDTISKLEGEGRFPFEQHIPATLMAVCDKALHFDPQKRYQNCLEFASAIQDWLDGVERKLRSLKILEEIGEIEKKQAILQQEFKENTDRVNQYLEQNLDSTEAWTFWKKRQVIHQTISKNEQKIKQLLQTSLIFDSENYEVYEKLFSLEYQLIQEAQLQRNILAEEIARSTLSLYLEILPKDIQKIWKRRLARQENATQNFRRLQHRLIGRNSVIQDVLLSFQERQLVSLVGSAGMGKTHLALNIANQWGEENEADTIFCDITSARDLDSVLLILGTTLSIPLTDRPQKAVLQALQNRGSLLLVLDNCEQVIQPLAFFIRKLLKRSAQIKILLTSRSVLNIPSEQVLRLSKIRLIEGVQIFQNRARKVRDNIQIDAQKFAAIARIVRRLEQVPLAIQLAAARASTLPISEIDFRLQESFSLLGSKLRTDQPETLNSALDWSWDLLSNWEKQTLAQCSWFKNGFTLKMAEQIIKFSAEDAPEVYELIEALVDDSLLRKDRLEDGEERYDMLASVREYTQKKLEEFQKTDPSLQSLPIRHAKFYAEQGKWYLSDQQLWSKSIIELDNFICAAKYGEIADVEVCIQVALRIIEQTGPWSFGLDLIEEFSKRSNLSVRTRAFLSLEHVRYLRMLGKIKTALAELKAIKKRSGFTDLYSQGSLIWEEGHLAEAQSKFKEALGFYQQASHLFRKSSLRFETLQVELDFIEILTKLGEYQQAQEKIKEIEGAVEAVSRTKLSIRYHHVLCTIHQYLGDYEAAQKSIERALFYNAKTHNQSLQIRLVLQRGTILALAEQYKEAIQNHQEALGLIRKIGDKRQESKSLITLGVCYRHLKQYERAEQMYRMALAINEEISHKRGLAVLYLNISQILPLLGRQDEVEDVLQKALRITSEIQDRRLIALFHSNLGRHYFQTGKIDSARIHFKKSADMNKEIGHRKGWALNLGNYANSLKHFKRWSEAESIYKKAIMMCLEMNIQIDGILIKGNLGELYWEMGDFGQAKEVLEDVYLAARKKNVKILQAVFGGTLALLYAQEKRFADAYQIFREMRVYVKEEPDEYPIFLCKKAWVYQLDNQTEKAKKTVDKIFKSIGELNEPKNWQVKLILKKFWIL